MRQGYPAVRNGQPGDNRREAAMKLYIQKAEDRDALAVILFRAGYTIQQGKEKLDGAKQATSYVEILEKNRIIPEEKA